MTSLEGDNTTHLFSKTDKTRPKVPFGTSVDEPDDGNSREYHLSHRVHHLLPDSISLEVFLHPSENVLICNPAVSYFRSIFQVGEQIIPPAL